MIPNHILKHPLQFKFLQIENNVQPATFQAYQWQAASALEQVLDLIVDSADIVRSLGRSIEKGKVDPASALNNLASAVRKLETATAQLRKS